jgi:hypothetical protein
MFNKFRLSSIMTCRHLVRLTYTESDEAVDLAERVLVSQNYQLSVCSWTIDRWACINFSHQLRRESSQAGC